MGSLGVRHVCWPGRTRTGPPLYSPFFFFISPAFLFSSGFDGPRTLHHGCSSTSKSPSERRADGARTRLPASTAQARIIPCDIQSPWVALRVVHPRLRSAANGEHDPARRRGLRGGGGSRGVLWLQLKGRRKASGKGERYRSASTSFVAVLIF